MKMKKIVAAILLVGSLGMLVTGCIEKETKEPIEATAEKGNYEASEERFNEFRKIVETNNTLQVKEFIEDNITNIPENIADKMAIEYEMLLNTNFKELTEKYNQLGTYFDAVNDTMDQQHKLHLEEIKDQKIKEEVMNLVASGYTFEMLEGSHYLAIDYTALNDKFGEYLSGGLQPYYELRKRDLEKPPFVEEVVSIDIEEIKNRVVTLEKAIRDNRELTGREDIKNLMKEYTQALLTVDYFSNTVDYETGKVEEDVKNVYKELKKTDLNIVKYAAEEMDKLLDELQYIIKTEDEAAYKKVNALKFKIVDEVAQMVDEYYSEK